MKPNTAAQLRYDQVNTTRIYLKLNNKTDMDILNKLKQIKATGSVQGYIKDLIKRDINRGD